MADLETEIKIKRAVSRHIAAKSRGSGEEKTMEEIIKQASDFLSGGGDIELLCKILANGANNIKEEKHDDGWWLSGNAGDSVAVVD